jgi:hypothetical protein
VAAVLECAVEADDMLFILRIGLAKAIEDDGLFLAGLVPVR